MKNIVEYFMQKDIIFKKFETILPKSLNSRKKVEIYLCIDIKGYYNVIISQKKSSRVLQKEVLKLHELFLKLQAQKDIIVKKKHYLLDGVMCSKAKSKMSELGWKVYVIS